jgi:hypothetical protein
MVLRDVTVAKRILRWQACGRQALAAPACPWHQQAAHQQQAAGAVSVAAAVLQREVVQALRQVRLRDGQACGVDHLLLHALVDDADEQLAAGLARCREAGRRWGVSGQWLWVVGKG